MEHTKHIWRAVIVLVVLAIGAFVSRHFLVPESFGQAGFYRYDSLAEFMEQEPVHGGDACCQECHEDECDEKAEGKHAVVRCEVCHAPVTTHVKGEEKVADMPVRRSTELCLICHQKLAARPKDMPQIVLMDHLITTKAITAGETPKDGICLDCHKSHDPSESPD